MGIYDVIKDGVKVVRNAGNVELSLEIAKIADELLEKQKKIEKLENTVNELNKKLKTTAEVEYKSGVYWLKNDNENEHPFCPRCYEKNKELISINTSLMPPDCPECKNNFDIDL